MKSTRIRATSFAVSVGALAGIAASLAGALPAKGSDVSFTGRAISASAKAAGAVFAVDMDGDGNIDVLSASGVDNKIAWYENDGGSPPSFTERVITTALTGAVSVFATDLDGDGDIDVISASQAQFDNKIVWYESDGASPPSFTERLILYIVGGATSIFATDVDGDGDTDILSASFMGSKLAWYESDGGLPPTFTEHEILTALGPHSVYATDVDGDGDTDILAAILGDAKIAWYESDGKLPPSFTERVITEDPDGPFFGEEGFAFAARSVFATDLDGDGDIDVLSASGANDKIAWYESDGGLPPTFTNRVISTDAIGAFSVFATDVDGDGDTDVLSASTFDNKIAWYESDGGLPPTFTEHVISTLAGSARSVFATDLDGDGDTDVLSAASTGNMIAWYENIPSIPGDFDGDGDVDLDDFARFQQNFTDPLPEP